MLSLTNALKKITSFDNDIQDKFFIEEINHLSDQEQAEEIALKFSSIQNEYQQLHEQDINIPSFSASEIPQFTINQVQYQLSQVKGNKSYIPGDLPPKIIKHFASYLAKPLTDIFNTSLCQGKYPRIYKREICTPIPKCYPVESTSQLRNISGLFTFDKIFEKLLSELILLDMGDKMDPSQYGNQKGVGIQHYLVKMIDKIKSSIDRKSAKENFAVLATYIDWENAFPRQCPKLGIESFLKNGVRPALIPLLINYFQDRKMSVKWHGCFSVPRQINGGGPQGATLGIIEYLSQSNNCSDFVDPEERFRFIDDLTLLEIINLVSLSIKQFDFEASVPSDLPVNSGFVDSENLKSQEYLTKISEWTEDQKMKLNKNKTKAMLFNFSKSKQFTTRLKLENENIEIVKEAKILGTIISDDLKWKKNTENIVTKANKRMQLLAKSASFGADQTDLKEIYILFIRSILEQSCPVWTKSITKDERIDIERVQKSAVRMILDDPNINYKKALNKLGLESLEERREYLSLQFAKKSLQNHKMKNLFPKKIIKHDHKLRNQDKFKINYARTNRYKNSAVPHMQKLLNDDATTQKAYKS